MASLYEVSVEAQNDLLAIWQRIAVDSVELANRMEDEFPRLFASLAEMPRQGPRATLTQPQKIRSLTGSDLRRPPRPPHLETTEQQGLAPEFASMMGKRNIVNARDGLIEGPKALNRLDFEHGQGSTAGPSCSRLSSNVNDLARVLTPVTAKRHTRQTVSYRLNDSITDHHTIRRRSL